MTGSGQPHNFLDDKTNTGKGIVIMDRNTTKYKVKQYIIFDLYKLGWYFKG